MAATLVDNVRINVTSMGTGALSLGSAVDGYRGVEALQNGKTYNYKVVAGAHWEVGQGQYLSSGAQLVRTPLYSSNGGGLVDLPQNAQVSFVALSSDFNGTGLSADAIAARDQAVAAAALAEDAANAALAIVDPVAAIPTNAGASVVGTADGGTVQGGLDSIPAQARQQIETALVALDDATDEYTIGQIINRIGLTPQMIPGFTVGASDHLAYFNTAIDRIIPAGGGALVLPPIAGDYKVSDAIQCHKASYSASNLTITGVGDKARIKRIAANKNLFKLGDNTNPLYYVTVKNIYSYAGITQTGGRIFDVRKANIITVKDCLFDQVYNGFYGEDLNTLQMDNVQFIMPYVASGRGVHLYSDPAGSGRTDIAVMNEVVVQAMNAGSDGWVIDGRVAGFHGNWCYALGTNRGFQFSSTGSGIDNIPSFCELNFCETDRVKDISLAVSKSYRLRIFEPEFSNTSGAMDTPYPQGSADHQAVYLDQGSILTSIFGGRIGNCREQAIYDDGKGTTIIGTALTDMAKDTGSDWAALYTGPHADGFYYDALIAEGYGRAKWAHQIETTANNGYIRPTRYQNLKSGGAYSTGTGAGNVTIDSGIATAYSY